MVEPTIIIAFSAGLISFLSPCVLPLIPAFIAYLSGSQINKRNQKLNAFLNTLSFVLGFSLIFSLLGILLNTLLEKISYTLQDILSKIGGIIIIFFALYILGIIKINFLQKEHKLKTNKKFSNSYISSFLFGTAFAFGWTPCVSAILGSIFALAITKPALSFILLFSYSLGLGIPFLITGLFTDKAIKFIKKSEKFLKYFNIIVGIILLILGILVFTNKLNIVANWFFALYFI